MRRGLVFGKFMPLHRGHQLLIEAAFAECDQVTVLVYDSPVGGGVLERMPVAKRLGWIADLYPQAEQILSLPDPWYGRPGHNGPEYAEHYARELEFLGRFDRVFTSEPAYAHFVEALGAEHRLLDEARRLVPISGTRIRDNLYEHRGWIDPLVYTSLIQKVVMVGTESTGKTTLARELARLYDTRWTHEFGREFWVEHGGGTFADHLVLAETQLRREYAAARHARDFLFCDTNAWTTLHWSLFAYGTVDERLQRVVERTIADYVWVLCEMDIPFEDDGVRELHGSRAVEMHEQQVSDLVRRGVPFVRAAGSLEERIATVAAALGGRPSPQPKEASTSAGSLGTGPSLSA
jgi:HTH-type transcriptional regulator, transcriptional repressor of NAD biosynthesis genes